MQVSRRLVQESEPTIVCTHERYAGSVGKNTADV